MQNTKKDHKDLMIDEIVSENRCQSKPRNFNRNLKLNNVYFEFTRRCNFKCQHCLRGDAQNITMTPQIIDRIFDQIDDVQGKLLITGGEPLLALDMVEYFINKLVVSSWSPLEIQLITNGCVTKNLKKVMDLCEKVYKSKPETYIQIGISQDEFRPANDPINLRFKTFDFFKKEIYRRGLGDRMVVSQNLLYDVRPGDNRTYKRLIYTGKAKKLYDDNPQLLNHLGYTASFPEVSRFQHIICTYLGSVNCKLSFCANGNISLPQELDYVSLDEHPIGNILEDDFKTIIERHNSKSLYLCWETQNYRCYSAGYFSLRNHNKLNFTDYKIPQPHELLFQANHCQIQSIKYERMFLMREAMQRLFPDLTNTYIIGRLPMPTIFEFDDLLFEMYGVYKGLRNVKPVSVTRKWQDKFLEMLNDKQANFDKMPQFYCFSANRAKAEEYFKSVKSL